MIGGFPCWEEVKFVIFTVDNQVAPLTLLNLNLAITFSVFQQME